MPTDITSLTTFKKRYFYQQEAYLRLIINGVKSFVSHFPFGYINFVVQLFITLISLPIYIGHVLEFWVSTILIVKPTLEDVGEIASEVDRKLIAKGHVRAIEEYKETTKVLITFLLGVLAAYFTQKYFSGQSVSSLGVAK